MEKMKQFHPFAGVLTSLSIIAGSIGLLTLAVILASFH